MWMTTINGKEEKMEDISHCFIWFPQFRNDFSILFEAGIIKRIAFDHYEWTKSKTSLAEYFHWIGNDVWHVPGGFWKSIETVFKVSRRTLSRLASSNGNDFKPKESKHFREIKKLVEQYRAQIEEQRQQDQKDRETFNSIKNLIEKTENKDIKKVRTVLKKIKIFLD